jgi:peptidyl-prolyl cis-trans isomerase D
VLRVTDHKPAEPRPLPEVRASIEADLKAKAQRDAATEKGTKALAKLQEGAAWSDVAAEFGLKAVGKRYVGRQDTIAPAAVVRAAFAAPSSAVSEAKPHLGGVATDDGNYAVFALYGIRPGNPATEAAADRKNRGRRDEQEIGAGEFAAYVAEAERNAKVVRNEKVFE